VVYRGAGNRAWFGDAGVDRTLLARLDAAQPVSIREGLTRLLVARHPMAITAVATNVAAVACLLLIVAGL
jgi:hypothetical protein